jgi:cyclophilin family peptidyl-prolyl cis-trans isomerase
MARFDDPNSAESSFSFLLGEAPHLDNQYTVFGEVIQNIEILNEIEKLPPKTVYIKSAEVVARKDLASLKLEPAHSMFMQSMKQSAAVQISFFTVLILLGLYFFEKYHDGKAAAQKNQTIAKK